MAFSGGAAQHNGLTPREVLISGNYNGNSVPVAVTSGGLLQSTSNGDTPITGGGAQAAISVSTTSAAIAAANSSRIRLWLYNAGPNTVYMNHSAAAVVATGLPFLSGERMLIEGEDAKLAWNGICDTAQSASIRELIGTTS